MNAEEFVVAMNRATVEGSASELMDDLANPVGRRTKSPRELDLAAWIKSLDDVTRGYVSYMLKQQAERTLFGVFCVIDGIRVIKPDCRFEIWQVDEDGNRVLIKGEYGEFLHDLYRAEFPHEYP